MQWQVEFLAEHRIVRVLTSGEMSLQDVLDMARDGLAEVARQSARGVLIVHQNTVPVMKIAEIYRLPNRLVDLGLPADLKVATVYPHDSPRKKDFEFYEDVSFNLGLKQVMFVDVETALGWLLKETEPRAGT